MLENLLPKNTICQNRVSFKGGQEICHLDFDLPLWNVVNYCSTCESIHMLIKPLMAQQTTDDILPPLHKFIYYQCYMMSQVTTKEHIATHNFEDFIYQ